MNNNLDYFEAYIGPFCKKDCIFCSEGGFGKRKFLNLKDFQNILEKNKFQKVVLTGGEPLLNKKIFDYVEICKQKNIFVSLVTAFEKDFSKNSLEKLISLGLDEIMISLEGPEKIHDFLVKEDGAYKNIIKNLVFLGKMKNIKTRIIIHTNINKINCKILPFFISNILKTFPFIFTYHVQMLEPFGNAYKNKSALFDTYSTLLKNFFEKFDIIYKNQKIKFGRLPFCIVPEKYHYIISKTPKIYEKGENEIIEGGYFGTKYENENCEICKKSKICDKFFNYYVDMYSDEEIIPY